LISGKNNLLVERFKKRNLGDKPQWADLQIPEWNVWNENVSDKMDFSDGYCGQEIHATDDLFQSNSHNDHQRYINYISPQRFLTNQASLETKGMPYTSKLFIGSCNKFPTYSRTIVEVAALQRRFIVVNCKLNAPWIPDTYDKSFSNLDFEVFQTGVDYVEDKNSTVMTRDQMVDYIIDRIQAKHKMYCEEMEWTYEFQADNPTIQNIDRFQMASIFAKCQNRNFSDWHSAGNDPEKAFISIMYKAPLDDSTMRLLEMCRTDTRYYNTEVVMNDYQMWVPYSRKAVERFCLTPCYFSTLVAGKLMVIAFIQDEEGKPTVYVFDDQIPRTWTDELQDKWDYIMNMINIGGRYSTEGVATFVSDTWKEYASFSKIFEAIQTQFLRGYDYFKSYCTTAISAFEALTLNILVALDMYDRTEILAYIASMVTDGVVAVAVGFIVINCYLRITTFLTKSKVCRECEIHKSETIDAFIDNLKETTCKKTCNIGYVYTSHSEICKSLNEYYDDFKAMCCKCKGSCKGECSHTVEEKSRKYHQFREIIKQHFGSVPYELDVHFSKHLRIVVTESEDFDMICRKCSTDRNCESHLKLKEIVKEITNPSDSQEFIMAKRLIDEVESESGCSLTTQKKKNLIMESGSTLSVKKRAVVLVESGSSLKIQKKKPVLLESSRTKPVKIPRVNEEGVESESELEYTFEMATDPALVELIDPLIKIVVRCHKYNDGIIGGSLNGLAYKDYVFTPAHLYDTNSDTYTFDGKDGEVEMFLVHADRDRDIAMWHHKGAPVCELLKRHLCSNDDLVRYLPSAESVVLVVPPKANKSSYAHLYHCKGSYLVNEKLQISSEGTVEFKEILRVVGINVPNIATVAGDCGAPLLMSSTKAVRKVIGFHILGGTHHAYSTVFTKERFEAMLLKHEKDVLQSEIHAYESEVRGELDPQMMLIEADTKHPVIDLLNLTSSRAVKPRFVASGDIKYIGEYDFNSVPAKESSLLDHPLQGAFEITQIPAVLEDGKVKDPSELHLDAYENPSILQTQLNKYCKEFTPVPGLEDDLKDMVEQLTPHYVAHMKSEDLTVMTEEQALSGMEDWEGSHPLDMRTTAGEPFSRCGKTPGKKKSTFLNIRVNAQGRKMYTLDRNTQHGRYLADACNYKESLAHKGYRTLSLWKNCLKDETRPVDKVEKGKTRLFTAAPFATVLVARKFFGKFKEIWQKNRLALFHSVGINPMSPDWSELALFLKAHGEDVGDADFSSYDGNLRSDFMFAAGEIVINTITQITGNDRTVYEVLWAEFVETFHVSGRNIHLIKHGNPSGNPMTTVVNCIVNFLYHWWCFRKISGTVSLSKFTSQVGFTCFGDDVLYSTNTKISNYTHDRISFWMSELGQDYTTATKQTGHVDLKTLDEVQFLKRTFKKVSKLVYLAPLAQDSIEQQFNYTQIGPNDFLTIQTQIDEACIEACLHGSDYYAHFRKRLSDAIWNNDLLRQHLSGIEVYGDVRATAERRILEQVS
jgi:hypothetical protein